MILGIMQPHFFPYVGYFSLINKVNQFIFFDIPQFKIKGWMNRVKLQSDNNQGFYITLPIDKINFVKGMNINNVRIDNQVDWKNKIDHQVKMYKSRAPYYWKVRRLIDTFLNNDYDYTYMACIESIKLVLDYLDIDFQYQILSEMNIVIEEIHHAGDWALNISKAIGADTYYNLPRSKDIFNLDDFDSNNIELKFILHNLPDYDQKRKDKMFVKGMSIIDVLMFNSKEETLRMIENCQVLTKNELDIVFNE